MKLCIIGPSKRTDSDIMLLNNAKNIFDSVLYAPYSDISMQLNGGRSVIYKSSNLSKFDAVLPRIKRNRYLTGYLLFNTLDNYTPITANAYMACSDRFLMLDLLKRDGLSVPDMIHVDSVKAAMTHIDADSMEFPIALRIPGSQKGIMFASSPKEATSMLGALKTFKKPVYMEKCQKKNDYYQAFVIGNEVVAAMKKSPNEIKDPFVGKGDAKNSRLSSELKNIAVNVANTLGTNFAKVSIYKKSKKVFNVGLCPNLVQPNKVFDKKVHTELLNYVKNQIKYEKKENKSLLDLLLSSTRIKFKDIFEK